MLVHQTMIINFILSIVWIIYMTLFYKIFRHISSSVRVTKGSKLIFSLRCERLRVRFPLGSRSLVKPIHMKSSMVFIRKLVILSRCVRINIQMLYQTRHVFVKHRCPRRQQSLNMAKFSKSYILNPPHPQGCGISVKCEEPIDEPTIPVWLLNHHQNFKYFTLFIHVTE